MTLARRNPLLFNGLVSREFESRRGSPDGESLGMTVVGGPWFDVAARIVRSSSNRRAMHVE